VLKIIPVREVETMRPPVRMNRAPRRSLGLGTWPNTAQAIACATTKKKTT